MKDAFGGILNLGLLAVFLLLVMGILGLIVNYTKAFRMKNFTIDTIERYEGACKTSSTSCFKQIESKAQSIAYSPTIDSCPSGYVNMEGYFCMKAEQVDGYDPDAFNTGVPCVYTVITQSDVSLPIIETVLSFRIFQVSGNTEIIEIPDGSCELHVSGGGTG